MAATFDSFSPDALQFLTDLRANNTRDWFTENKAAYDSLIKAPAKAFSDQLAEDLSDLTSMRHLVKIFRVNRDVRFSKDKSPYNTHLHISFTPDLDSTAPPVWMFGLNPERLSLGVGTFAFDKQSLAAFRDHVAGAKGAAFADLLTGLTDQDIRLGKPDLKRVPSGFDADHPRATLLRYKGLTAWHDAPPDFVTTPDLPGRCREVFGRLLPLFSNLKDL